MLVLWRHPVVCWLNWLDDRRRRSPGSKVNWTGQRRQSAAEAGQTRQSIDPRNTQREIVSAAAWNDVRLIITAVQSTALPLQSRRKPSNGNAKWQRSIAQRPWFMTYWKAKTKTKGALCIRKNYSEFVISAKIVCQHMKAACNSSCNVRRTRSEECVKN